MPSSIRLAQILASGGDTEGALAALRVALTPQSRSLRGGAVELALMRALGQWDDAAARLAYWLTVDPTDKALRYEASRLGQDDGGGLNAHLAADPQRILNLAEHLMALGQYTDALDILTGTYDSPDAAILEPGIPRASQHPLIWYYRGYCREKAGQSGANEYRIASGLPVQFVFPNKAITADVLTAALRLAPDDATALWLRGCALLALRRDCRLDLVCEC